MCPFIFFYHVNYITMGWGVSDKFIGIFVVCNMLDNTYILSYIYKRTNNRYRMYQAV